MWPEDRASRRVRRRMSGQYIEDRQKRRERRIARKLRLALGRRTDRPNITLLSRDDLDMFVGDEYDRAW